MLQEPPPSRTSGAWLFDELVKLSEILVSDVTALAKRKLLDGARLRELEGAVGYKNVAFDVLLFCALLRDRRSTVQGRTAVQPSELDRAEVLADRLATAVALRDQGASATSGAGELRHQAFTRFVQAYDQARRVLSYLRWNESDVDSVIPSLYAGRGGRGKQPPATDATQPATPATATPPNTTHAITPPAVGAPAPTTKAPSAAATKSSIGMPGDDPFSS